MTSTSSLRPSSLYTKLVVWYIHLYMYSMCFTSVDSATVLPSFLHPVSSVLQEGAEGVIDGGQMQVLGMLPLRLHL